MARFHPRELSAEAVRIAPKEKSSNTKLGPEGGAGLQLNPVCGFGRNTEIRERQYDAEQPLFDDSLPDGGGGRRVVTARRPCSHSPGLTAGSGTSIIATLTHESKYLLQSCRVPGVAVPIGALTLASNCCSSSSRSFHHQQIAVAAAHPTGRLSAPPPCQTTFLVHDRRNLQIVQLLQVGLSASSCLASIYKHQKPAVAIQPPLTPILSIAIPLSAICNCNGFLLQPHPRPHLTIDSRSFPLKHRSRHRLWLSSRLSPPTPTSRKAPPKMLSTRRVVFCHALTQFHSRGSKSFSCPEQEAVLRPFSTA